MSAAIASKLDLEAVVFGPPSLRILGHCHRFLHCTNHDGKVGMLSCLQQSLSVKPAMTVNVIWFVKHSGVNPTVHFLRAGHGPTNDLAIKPVGPTKAGVPIELIPRIRKIMARRSGRRRTVDRWTGWTQLTRDAMNCSFPRRQAGLICGLPRLHREGLLKTRGMMPVAAPLSKGLLLLPAQRMIPVAAPLSKGLLLLQAPRMIPVTAPLCAGLLMLRAPRRWTC
jgi:hypothetical protein